MKVKCTDDNIGGLTEEKIYDADEFQDDFFVLTNDNGDKGTYYKERFEVIDKLDLGSLPQDLIDYHKKGLIRRSIPVKEFKNIVKGEKMKYKLVKKLSGSAIADKACEDEFEKFVKKFGYYTNVEWTKEVEDYCIEQGWIDFLFYEGYLNKNREIKGYFNGVETWSEAIELLKKADQNFLGEFVEIDGDIYFHLELDNTADWRFTEEGQKLLT